jgi:hypothetical protein
MDRVYTSGASATPPSAPGSPSSGYPTAGNPSLGVQATRPGAWWYYMITEEIRNVLVAAGITPDHEDLTQLSDAIAALISAAAPPLARAINTTSPLQGGGNLSADRTLSIQDGTTAQKGAVQLYGGTDSTSNSLAATAGAVKTAYDAVAGRIVGGASLGVGCITLGRIDGAVYPTVSTGDDAVAKEVYCDGSGGTPTGSWTVLGVYTNTDGDHTVLIQRTA